MSMNEEMCENDQWVDKLQRIKCHFFQMMPLRVFNQEDFNYLKMKMSQRYQIMLFQLLFGSQHASLFKVSNKYKRSFLKKLINELESDGVEVIEELYNEFVNLLTFTDEKENFAFRSYFLRSLDLNIVMKESTQIISSGTTGLVSWEACYALGEWAVSNNQIFKNRVVLELGSGPGLLGVLICKTCNPHTYIFSDHHERVLELLLDNLKINNLSLDVGETNICSSERDSTENINCSREALYFSSKYLQSSEYMQRYTTIMNCDCCRSSDLAKCKACCWKLDWQNRKCLDLLQKENIDVVLGSDLVYDLSLIPYLVNVLACVLRKSTKVKSYLGTTIRNEETYSCFLKSLDDHQLSWQLVDMAGSAPLLNYQGQSKVEILEIFSRV